MTDSYNAAPYVPCRRVGDGSQHHFFGYYNKSNWDKTNRLLLETGHGLAALCGWINALTGLSLSVNPEAFDVSNLDFRVINTAMAGQFNLHMKISFVMVLPKATGKS